MKFLLGQPLMSQSEQKSFKKRNYKKTPNIFYIINKYISVTFTEFRDTTVM